MRRLAYKLEAAPACTTRKHDRLAFTVSRSLLHDQRSNANEQTNRLCSNCSVASARVTAAAIHGLLVVRTHPSVCDLFKLNQTQTHVFCQLVRTTQLASGVCVGVLHLSFQWYTKSIGTTLYTHRHTVSFTCACVPRIAIEKERSCQLRHYFTHTHTERTPAAAVWCRRFNEWRAQWPSFLYKLRTAHKCTRSLRIARGVNTTGNWLGG